MKSPVARWLLAIGTIALVGCASDVAQGPSCDEVCAYYESCGSTVARDECLDTCDSDYAAPEEAGCRTEQAALFECNIDAGCTGAGSLCADARDARNECVCASNPGYWACGI